MRLMRMFTRFFKRTKNTLTGAVNTVISTIPEETLRLALVWARVAAVKYVDNDQRREFVVGILRAKGLPESIARLAVELAVRLLKKELSQ